MKCTHIPEIETLFSKQEKRQKYSSISDCKTVPEEGSGIYNKTALFIWTYYVSLKPCFFN